MIELLFTSQLAEKLNEMQSELGIIGVVFLLLYYLIGQYVFQKACAHGRGLGTLLLYALRTLCTASLQVFIGIILTNFDIPEDGRIQLQVSFWRYWKPTFDRRRASGLGGKDMVEAKKGFLGSDEFEVARVDFNFQNLMPRLYQPGVPRVKRLLRLRKPVTRMRRDGSNEPPVYHRYQHRLDMKERTSEEPSDETEEASRPQQTKEDESVEEVESLMFQVALTRSLAPLPPGRASLCVAGADQEADL